MALSEEIARSFGTRDLYMTHIHMLGICGTGMGSLALLLKEAGYHVTGSDENVYPPMSTQLEKAGIKIFQGYKVENLNPPQPPFTKGGDHCSPPFEKGGKDSPPPFEKGGKDSSPPFEKGGTGGIFPELIIIGNVISRGNPEAEAVLAQGLKYLSMPQAVSELFLKDKHSIVVAGTHGKTTASNLCAWILESAGLKPGFLIGGVGINFGVSARYVAQDFSPANVGRPKGLRYTVNENYFVIEGDEYDTAFFDKGPKFLHYQPRSVILGPIEFDHADIYRDLAHVMSSFEKLMNIIPADGLLVACADSENTLEIAKKAKCRVVTYGTNINADYHPEDIHVSEAGTRFALVCGKNPPSPPFEKGGKDCSPPFIKGGPGGIYISPLYGNHNMQNAIGVIALLTELGIEQEKIAKGLETFKGIKRRQEVRGIKNGITVIDDFAHHPTAIRETIEAMRMRYPKRTHPNRRIFAIFEPRSNTSRRNIFQDDFAKAMATADTAILAGIHRIEKVPPEQRLDIAKLIKDINAKGTPAFHFEATDDIIAFVLKEAKKDDVILIMSNGGFDNIHERILKGL